MAMEDEKSETTLTSALPTVPMNQPVSYHEVDWIKLQRMALPGWLNSASFDQTTRERIVHILKDAISSSTMDACLGARIDLVSIVLDNINMSNRKYRRLRSIFSALKTVHHSSGAAHWHSPQLAERFKDLIGKILECKNQIRSRNQWIRLEDFVDLLDTNCFEVGLEDCESIIWNLIYPRFGLNPNFAFYKRADADWYGHSDRGHYCDKYCSCQENRDDHPYCCSCCKSKHCYINKAISAIHRQHPSILCGLVESALTKLLEGSTTEPKLDQATSFLCLLLRLAQTSTNCQLFNQTMVRLMISDRVKIKSRCCWLFAMVHKDAGDLESLSGYLDFLIKMEDDPSDEVKKWNRRAWRSIARIRVVGPHCFKAIRAMINRYMRKLDRISENQLEPLKDVLWLMMPRLQIHNPNPYSTVDLLVQDLLRLVQIGGGSRFLCEWFSLIHRRFAETPAEFDEKLMLASYWANTCWAGWRFIKQLSAAQLIGLENIGLLFKAGQCYPYQPDSYEKFCELMLDIYNHTKDQGNCSWGMFLQFLRSILSAGPWQRYEEGIKLVESLVVGNYQNLPMLDKDDEKFSSIIRHNWASGSIGRFFRLTYFITAKCMYQEACDAFAWHIDQESETRIEGIQSRRMMLVSLCKMLIFKTEHLHVCYLISMLNLLEQLSLAYRLRATQDYSCTDGEALLLPTCIELAFPTPFDDANSSVYICEFAYFRDTLVYLERNKLEKYRETCEGLSCGEIRKLDYYRNSYDEFDTCCATTTRDGIKFSCTTKGYHSELEHELCPLLRRKQFFR